MKYTITKRLALEVTVEADSAQAAYEAQLELDDNTFVVSECDYEIADENGDDVSHELED